MTRKYAFSLLVICGEGILPQGSQPMPAYDPASILGYMYEYCHIPVMVRYLYFLILGILGAAEISDHTPQNIAETPSINIHLPGLG